VEKKALTEKAVANAKLPAGKAQVDLWDAALPGFGLRVGERKKSWNIIFRLDRKQKRHVFGTYPAMPLAAARRRAGELRSMVDAGKDPRAELERQREEEANARADTVKAVVERYLASIGEAGTPGHRHKPLRLRTGKEIKRILEKYVVPAIGNKPMKDVTRRQLVELLDNIAEHNGPAMANRTLSRVSRLFTWALGKSIITGSPAIGIERPAREVTRSRKLSDDEIRRVWAACDRMGDTYARFVQFLMVTGVRRSEAGEATRDEIGGSVWIVPPRRQKSDVEHAVALTPLATEILDRSPAGRYLFPSDETGGPLSSFSRRKALLDAAIAADGGPAMEGWVLHDLRRVIRSHMSAMKIDENVAEKVLGHVPKGLRKTYDRHSYFDEKKEALEMWARQLRAIVDPSPTDNVVSLRAVG
jgi:integrase